MNPKHRSLATGLLAALGLLQGPTTKQHMGLIPPFAGVHTTIKLRRSQRALCKRVGKRQYRRLTRESYALRDGVSLVA